VPPTAAASDTLRLFIALWPDDGARDWLLACDAAIAWPVAAAREDAARRHITLHFLGAVPSARLHDLMPALQQPFAPFDLELGRIALWPRGLLVMEPTRAEPALLELHAALGAALQRAGRSIETRAFRPHVTLARRAAGARWLALSPQRWPVSAYALVASAGGRYRNVAVYPCGVFSGSSADPAPATAQIPPAPRPTPR
jgi:RNA 2',3'-cyclic 3'-phosphodiesterase